MDDMITFAIDSHKKAAAARDEGKFAKEIVPVKGKEVDGTEFMVDKDQWIRDKLDPEQMKTMKTPFKENGRVTAATSSPLTAGAAGLLMMSREKADELGLSYSFKYAGGAQAGNDPTMMGVGPIYSVRKLLERTGVTLDQIGPVELNEAFASQALACTRELKLDNENAPFKRLNVWGGATALGHPLGESGARIIVTLLNIMKTDFKDAKYGMGTLCGGFGNSNAILIERI
jgi:acetyl-CoA acetyltransferase family protein